MPSIAGIFNTANQKSTTDLVKVDFASLITRLMPNGTAPLFALTSYIPDETALQTEHGYFTKTMMFPSFTIDAAAGYAVGITAFTVNDTSQLIPGMILQLNNTTQENVMIVSVDSATTITVQRAVGGTASAIVDNAVAYMVGNAYEEASNRPSALSVTPVRMSNLTQIFRNTWALSGSAQATAVIAGDTTEAENKQDCAAFHAQAIESALFFGRKYSGTRNGQPIRTMDGLVSMISNIANYPSSYSAPNVFDASTINSGNTNFNNLESMLDPVFNQTTDPKNASERLLFVGGTAHKVINNIGRLSGNYQIMNDQTSFGLQFGTFKTTRGTFRMIEHPLFNSNAIWNKMAVAVDPSSFNLAYLNGRKTQNKEFNSNGQVAQDFGIDAVGGTLTTECTLLVKNPPANAIITNLANAVA